VKDCKGTHFHFTISLSIIVSKYICSQWRRQSRHPRLSPLKTVSRFIDFHRRAMKIDSLLYTPCWYATHRLPAIVFCRGSRQGISLDLITDAPRLFLHANRIGSSNACEVYPHFCVLLTHRMQLRNALTPVLGGAAGEAHRQACSGITPIPIGGRSLDD
jgi:hypothetical protein